MSDKSGHSDSAEGLELGVNSSILKETETNKCLGTLEQETHSTESFGNNFVSLSQTANNVYQPCSNIKNILNLGQEIPDEIQAIKVDESKSVKKGHHRCAYPGRCKRKLNAVKKKNSHSKRRHCHGLKKERDVPSKIPDVVGGGNMVSDNNFEIEDDHNLAEQLSYDNEMYDPVHDDFYDKFTKVELIERWIETEDQIEAIDKHINAVRERKRLLGLVGVDVDAEIAKIQVFKEEINKLIEENNELFQANQKLKSYLNTTEEQEAYVRQ